VVTYKVLILWLHSAFLCLCHGNTPIELLSKSSSYSQIGNNQIIFSFIKIKKLHGAISNDCSRCFNTGIYFQAKTCFSKLACEMLNLSWCTINPLVQAKLLQMSQDLKIECLVKCLTRNKFIVNNSSDFKRGRLLWASPAHFESQNISTILFQNSAFYFWFILKTKSNHVIIFSTSKLFQHSCCKVWDNRYSQFLFGLDFLAHNGLDFPLCLSILS
jgi:hypothetical protein